MKKYFTASRNIHGHSRTFHAVSELCRTGSRLSEAARKQPLQQELVA